MLNLLSMQKLYQCFYLFKEVTDVRNNIRQGVFENMKDHVKSNYVDCRTVKKLLKKRNQTS